MGNKLVTKKNDALASEMSSVQYVATENKLDQEPLCDLDKLQDDCLTLKTQVQELAEAIDEIFEEPDSPDKELESSLQQQTRENQELVHKLTRQLERHAKARGQGSEFNERVIALVKDVVCTVNSYMAMLIRNIRKLKRLISELEQKSGRSVGNGSRQVSALNTVHDVISDQQDVDAMLLQLMETEAGREVLERDMVTVLGLWHDIRALLSDTEVLEAADSVALGLAHLSDRK